jgi:alkanesulfonate monooxygenase SsuD/methylene tetrahydromethanopterin reductase-like flavin-dependent oxidoreductase (luciferase family)
MLQPGLATYRGDHASVVDAYHAPLGLQTPRIPILIGGNGPKVTWRLAARFADELNLDALPPEAVRAALPVIAERCGEIGRDPATLRVSVHVWGDADAAAGSARQDRLREYAELGLSRAILQGFAGVTDPGVIEAAAADGEAVGMLGEAEAVA